MMRSPPDGLVRVLDRVCAMAKLEDRDNAIQQRPYATHATGVLAPTRERSTTHACGFFLSDAERPFFSKDGLTC